MPFILGTNSIKASGFDVANSVRFDDGDSAYLQKSASAGNRRTFTFSTWLKRGNLTCGYATFFSSDQATENSFRVTFDDDDGSNDDRLMVYYFTGSHQLKFITNRQFRDCSAWYHIVIAVDTTQSTENQRFKIYVNGTQETSFSTATYPSQNLDTSVNQSGAPTRVGAGTGLFFDGYMAETVLIDGTQYAASDFGEFDSDSPTIWKPKDVSGLTFGTNGFYLDYKSSSNLGNDANGGTDLTATNLAATDQSTDTCTNNFATLNPLLFHTYSGTYSEGNLKIVASNDSWYADASTIAPSSGKFYMEVKITAIGNFCALGVGAFPFSNVGHSQLIGELSNTIGWRNNGVLNQNGSAGTSLNSFTTNDIIGMYLDLDNGKFYFSKNGTLESSTGLSLTTGLEYFFVVNPRGSTLELNFGSPPYSVSSSNTDDNGYGNFEYSPNITGDGVAKKFYALNTKNLAEYGG